VGQGSVYSFVSWLTV